MPPSDDTPPHPRATPDQMAELLRQSLDHFKHSAELIEANNVEMSKLMFHRFKSLQDAGFSRPEALQIVLTRGLS